MLVAAVEGDAATGLGRADCPRASLRTKTGQKNRAKGRRGAGHGDCCDGDQREDYPRFVGIFGPDVQVSHAAYYLIANGQIKKLKAGGISCRKVYVDPDAMAEWCMDNHGRIDSKVRAIDVAIMAMQGDRPGKEG